MTSLFSTDQRFLVLPLDFSPVLCGPVHLVQHALQVPDLPAQVLNLGLGVDALGLVLLLKMIKSGVNIIKQLSISNLIFLLHFFNQHS